MLPFKTSNPFWAQDTFDSTDGAVIKYDKLEHIIFFGALSWVLTILGGVSPTVSAIVVSLLGLGLEFIHWLLNYRDVTGIWKLLAGDGFSWRDLIANEFGILTVLIHGAIQG